MVTSLPLLRLYKKHLMKDNTPIQYKRGWVEFYKLRFKVTQDVLIPRPETELLVDEVLRLKPKVVLDIGTGSGNIAISIAKNLPGVKVIASDISIKALKIAKQNAKLHAVKEQIDFIISDLLENINMSSDVIVTNLPYIPTERISYLDSSVKDYEPRIALDGGEDGFSIYRKLFVQMKEKKIFPKYFFGEIDYTHGDQAMDEAGKLFPDSEFQVKTDLNHKQRILKITF